MSPIVKLDSATEIKREGNKPDTVKTLFGITANGNRIDTATKIVQVQGPDPYFNNVPPDQSLVEKILNSPIPNCFNRSIRYSLLC